MLFSINRNGLGRSPRLFRYLYFLLSSFRLISFGQWKAKGEPNPFVPPKAPQRRHTSQQEILDIFQNK